MGRYLSKELEFCGEVNRKDCILDHLISDRELDVFVKRRAGMTFAKIGEEMGLCYQRVQQIYLAGLESLRIEQDIRRQNKFFFKSANDFNWTPKQLKRLYRLLKENKILYVWQDLSDEELLDIYGFGVTYLDFLKHTKENYLL